MTEIQLKEILIKYSKRPSAKRIKITVVHLAKLIEFPNTNTATLNKVKKPLKPNK